MIAELSSSLLLALTLASAVAPDVRNARDLFFDRRYQEARQAWQDVHRSGQGQDAQLALYWIARCSEGLGERQRALDEYGRFLSSGAADDALLEEARTHRVGLAISLVRRGQPAHLAIVEDALKDESRTLRYFAALEGAGLGQDVDRAAVPVLKQILARERDADLVGRAKLRLLQIDPQALRGTSGSAERRPARTASWVKVRISEAGRSDASVSISLPLALAELVFKSLPDDARRELAKKGYDDANFWTKLREMGPTQIVDIQGEDGEHVQVWTE
jgi:hypothetical protein